MEKLEREKLNNDVIISKSEREKLRIYCSACTCEIDSSCIVDHRKAEDQNVR